MNGWHVPSGFSTRGLSVGDVLRYETEDLGNDLGVTVEQTHHYDGIPAQCCVWAAKAKREVGKYAQAARQTPVRVEGEPIACDGEGGYLLLLTSGSR